ncbi:MAG: CpsB/CapC family capsule biosynthesis tyrosine phosphatase, partial [Gemmatimonadaceae bacterium]
RVLERLAIEGVTEVACTPHLAASRAHETPIVLYAELREQLQRTTTTTIQLHAGFEIMLDRPGMDLTLPGLSLGGSNAVLVEFPHGQLPEGHTEELLRLRTSGIVPVIAHPERYGGMTLEIVKAWREVGTVIQGDALLLLSTGSKALLARTMLEEGVYDILASDNHGDRRSLATVRLWLNELKGGEQGEILTQVNPSRVLSNSELQPVAPLREERGVWQRLRALVGKR